MNKFLTLLTSTFAVIGIITSVMFFLTDINTIKYIQISIVGFFVFDALRELNSKQRNRKILIFKSTLAIVISTLMVFILLY